MYANRVFPVSQYSTGIFKPRASIILKSFRSFSDITEVKQNLRSIVTDFKTASQSAKYCSIPNLVTPARKAVRESPLLSKSLLKLTEPFWISHVSCFFCFFWHRTLISESFLPSRFYDRSAFYSNCFLLTLLYKTAVVETPQSALWPIQNTTKRFVVF